VPSGESFQESRMREIRTSGLTRGEATHRSSPTLLAENELALKNKHLRLRKLIHHTMMFRQTEIDSAIGKLEICHWRYCCDWH